LWFALALVGGVVVIGPVALIVIVRLKTIPGLSQVS
jgi:hypothetical protein